MKLSPLAETILIDGLDGGHMWGEPENRLTLETLIDSGHIESMKIRSASGDMFRMPKCISRSGIQPARSLKAAKVQAVEPHHN